MQEDYFARHLELSRRTNKPVVIHCREADADVLRMLRADFDRHGPIRGVMHSFVGDAAMGEACLAMGLVPVVRGDAHLQERPGVARGRGEAAAWISYWWRRIVRICRPCRCAASATSRRTSSTRRPVWRGCTASRRTRWRSGRRGTARALFGLPG